MWLQSAPWAREKRYRRKENQEWNEKREHISLRVQVFMCDQYIWLFKCLLLYTWPTVDMPENGWYTHISRYVSGVEQAFNKSLSYMEFASNEAAVKTRSFLKFFKVLSYLIVTFSFFTKPKPIYKIRNTLRSLFWRTLCSVAKLCLTLCDPMEGRHANLPSLPLPPRVCSNSCPLSWWCYPTISFSVTRFSSCPQSFPASGSLKHLTLFFNWVLKK